MAQEITFRNIARFGSCKLQTALSRRFLAGGEIHLARKAAFKISAVDIIRVLDRYPSHSDSAHSKIGTDFSGAEVALLGPGKSGTASRLIEKYGMVARVGYIDASSSELILDRTPDFSFLAAHHATSLIGRSREGGNVIPSPTRFLVRDDGVFHQMRVLTSIAPSEWFDIRPAYLLFSSVTPNFAPQVIMYILSHGPKELHISHLDLFTSTEYAKGYPVTQSDVTISQGSLTHSTETMRRSFSQFHNPFTHFSFYKSLQHLPNVTMSVTLRAILSSGITAYGERLKELYYTP